MDYDNNQNQPSDHGTYNLQDQSPPQHTKPPLPPPRPAPPMPVYMPSPPRPRRRSFIGAIIKYLFIIAVIFSILMNLYMVGLLTGGIQEQIYQSGNRQQKIALINLSGTINMQTASRMRKMIRQATDDKAVKAVILVVNSPGGQVAPSNMVNRYIRDFKKNTHKPFYVCIEQMGASGAYWISVAADKIYAQTNAMVGSIGVIYINFIVEKALKEKLGIIPLVIKSSKSPFKDENSPFRLPSEQEKLIITKDLDTVHKRFVEVVSQGRHLTTEKTWQFANGKVFDGPEALQNHLIDAVGFLDDAIKDIIKTKNLSNPMVVQYLRAPKLSNLLSLKAHNIQIPLNFEQALQNWAAQPKIQALYMGN